MKIAMFYDTRPGRNDGPPLYWRHALETLGHKVIRFTSQNEPLGHGEFDLYLWIDWGEDALTGILPYKPICMKDHHPSAYVTSDTHLGFEYRLEKAKEFDYVFCNQERAVREFGERGVEARWLPHAVEPRAYPNKPECIKKYDVGFVGFVTFEKRADALDRIYREFPNFFYGQRLFEEAAEVYRKSRIVFNTSADDDVNMRLFEVLATGAFLLTEHVPTIGDFGLIDGKHFVSYLDLDDAVAKAMYFLKHEDKREEIAKDGMEAVLAGHTYQHRAKEVLNIIIPKWECNNSNEMIKETVNG